MSNLMVIKKSLIDPKTQAQIKMALPANVTPEKFVRVAMTALNNSQDLANCTPESVMNGLLKCAADGLLPDNREAALVKFGNQAQYMPMVYGLIKRMRNSGEVSTVNAYIVYENDDMSVIKLATNLRSEMSFSNNNTLVTLLKVDYVSVIVNSVEMYRD